MNLNNNYFYNKRSRQALMSEVNVTPLVDVILVLLIVFMIASPMLVAGIKVDLPDTEAAPLVGTEEPLVVNIDSKGEIYIFETHIDRSHLTEKLKNITKEKMDTRIFVRGDKKIAYGYIVEVIGSIHAAGFAKVALISNIKDNGQKR